MIAKISNKVRRLNSLKAWSAITGIALIVALVLTLAPFGVGINTNGLISISLSQVGANPDWLEGWTYRKEITVTNANADYQTKVLISKAASAGDTPYFTLASTINTAYPNEFDIYDGGNRTIVAGWGTSSLRLYDTSNKQSPDLLDTLAEIGIHDVKILAGDDDYAYFCRYSTTERDYGYVGIANLTNESNITEEDLETLARAFYVCPVTIGEDKYVLAVTHWTSGMAGDGTSDGLYIYKVTDHTLTLQDSLTGSGTGYNLCEAWRVKYHTGYQYAIVCSTYDGGKVTVLNISDPTDITPLNVYSGDDWLWANCFIEGNKLYGSPGADIHTMYACTINANGTLTKLGNYSNADYLENCHGIFVEDDIIYAGVWGNDGITVLDATNPASISYMGGIYDAALLDSRHACHYHDGYVWTAGAYGTTCITIHSITYGAGEEVNCEGHCLDNFYDLRFTELDGETLVPHWRESVIDIGDTKLASAWIKNNGDPETTLYMYYGKADAPDVSSGTDTFRAFEDFTGVEDDHIFTVVGDHIIHDTTNDWLDFTGMTTNEDSYAYLDMEAGQIDDFLMGFTAKLTFSSVGAERAGIGVADELDDAYNNNLFIGFDGIPHTTYQYSQSLQMITTSATTGTPTITMTNGGIYYYTLTRIGTTTILRSYSDAARTTQVGSDSVLTSSTAAVRYLFAIASLNYADAKALGASYVTDIYLAKYVATEPSFAFGSEETEEECSPNYYVSPASWSINGGNPISEGSSYSTGLSYFTVTNNNSGGAIDITVSGSDMTGGGYTWDLADDGSPGDMIYGLYAGLSGGDYTIIVKESAPYNTLVSNLANNASQSFGLKHYTPTNFDDGNDKSGGITLTVVCS